MSSREYQKLTVNLLKEELKRRSLDQSGKKADLVARLEKDDDTSESQKQILNTNEDTNNTEDFDNESKDLKEVEKPDDGPSFNNSINNVDNSHSNNNDNADNSHQMEEGFDHGNTCKTLQQQQQDLSSTTNNNEAQNNSTNVSQSVDTTSATSAGNGAVMCDASNADNGADMCDASNAGNGADMCDASNAGNGADMCDASNAGNGADMCDASNAGNGADMCDASNADAENGVTQNHHGDSGIGSSTTPTTITSFNDDVTGSNNTTNNPAISSDNDNQAISSNNNQSTSSTTNDNMDTSDCVVKESIDSNNPTTSDNNNYNNSDTTNEAKSENNEAKSDSNNEAEKSENKSETPTKEGSTTDVPASDPTTTTTSETITTPTKGGEAVVDLKKRAQEDTNISQQFCIEMKRDFDAFQLKWHGKKFKVPFLAEIVSDLSAEVSKCGFQVSGLTKEEMKNPVVMAMIEAASKYSINFMDNILGDSNTGSMKMVFKSREERVTREAEIKDFKEDVVVEVVKFDDLINQQFLHKELAFYKSSIVDRLLYVGNIASEAKEEGEYKQLEEIFSGAVRMIIPAQKEANQSNYVYFEYESPEAVLEAAEAHKDESFMENKLFVIKALCVKKERYGLLTDTLREILLEKIRKMKRIQKNPWNRSKQEINEIDKAITMNMEKLATDSKHRKNWGMELGVLDETRIEKEDFSSSTPNNRSTNRGNKWQNRGGSRGGINSSTPYDNRRSSGSGQRYGNYYGSGSSSNVYGGNRSGWASSSQSSGYYGSSAYQGYTAQNQGYGTYPYTSQQLSGQQQPVQSSSYYSSANKRKSSETYGSDWKRPRNF